MQRQMKLDPFLKPLPHAPAPRSVPHREIVLYILQLGIALTEKSLLRAVKQEIIILQKKGRDVTWMSLKQLRQQLHQLAREEIVEQIGYCWRLRY